jgi:hypothetical protein
MKLFLAEPFASKWQHLDPFKEVFMLSGETFRDMVLSLMARLTL